MTATFNINDNTYPFAMAKQAERKTKKGVIPALEYPVVESADPAVLGSFVTDLLNLAESKKQGNASEVFAGLFHKTFKTAYVEVPNAESLDLQDLWDAILNEIVKLGAQKLDLEKIGKEIIEEQTFLAQFTLLRSDTPEQVAAKNAAREAEGVSEDEFIRRVVAVNQRQIDWLRASNEHEQKSAERAQKMREAKAKKAAEAAAAAPAN